MANPAAIMELTDVCVDYPMRGRPIRGGRGGRRGWLRAVDEVSFNIHQGEAVALVGESGSGKSTLGKAMVQLVRPSAGRIAYFGTDLAGADRDTRRRLSRDVQMVFQDSAGSLNPKNPVGRSVAEPLVIHRVASARERAIRVDRLLEQVGLSAGMAHRFPHELSGGQRQRVAIARALILEPSLLICDEATSALDVSIQAQIINLLLEAQETRGVALLIITHDLDVARCVADRVAVMRRGRFVEQGEIDAVFKTPQATYTKELIAAIPVADPSVVRHER